MNTEIDIRGVLSSIAVPTLLLHRSGDRDASVDESRYLASHIPGAHFEELPGEDHLMSVGDVDEVVGAIEEFLTGVRSASAPERVLATILFTDIVGSTAMAAEVGDRRWRELLEQHHALVREQLTRYRGQELDTAGEDSSPDSTDLRAPYGVRLRSRKPWAALASVYVPACTRASAS
jgi:hypothetical protein